MNLHEFQAKEILQQYGIAVPDFVVVSSMEELLGVIDSQNLASAVIKVQVHAGGRGKAGGVKIAKSRQEIIDKSKALLGMKIVNNQTGPQGVVAHQILLSPLVDIKRELYLAATVDRKNGRAVIIASTEGGVDIEETAESHPEKILTFPITQEGTIRSYNILRLNHLMGWTGPLAEQGASLVQALAKAFVETDAALLEINPLVETPQGQLLALDAKFSVDENALYRQPKIAKYYDPSQQTPEEVKAKEFDLAYVGLSGNIGCMVNGAGLAMATMDIIKHYGGTPANFLDVGGGASQEKVAAGFKIILADPHVKAILVNIFGGIMNCATLASGITAAVKELSLHVPLIVRMEGTNVKEGKEILAKSGLNIILAADLKDAAQKAVAACKE